MNHLMELTSAALFGATVASAAIIAVCARRCADRDDLTRAVEEGKEMAEAQGKRICDLIKDKDQCAARLRRYEAEYQKMRTDLLDANRNRGWKGVYTKADGQMINVEGHGTRNGTDRPIVENLDKPGSTLFDVPRDRVRWEG